MNEFEWRRQMRELRQPLMPGRDIWHSIDAALEDVESSRVVETIISNPPRTRGRHRWAITTGIAASLMIAGGIAWYLRQTPAPASIVRAPSPSVKWKPSDPRFAGAAIELDAARMELQQAIRQAPDASGLQRILARTERQQTQLRELAREPG